MKKTIAIVGAGICGSTCARLLVRAGYSVKVFDKGRGPGGRLSSRRAESGHRFDHGASRLDVTRHELHEFLAPAVAAGMLDRSEDRYTSATGMNALCKWLLDGVDTQCARKITRLEHDGSWTAFDEAGQSHGPFDAMVLAIPPVNAAEIVGDRRAELQREIASVRMLPRWVGMLGFAEKLSTVPDHTVVDGNIVRRSRSNSHGDALVVEASQQWSVAHLESDPSSVGQRLLDGVRPLLGAATPTAVYAHRWRYAFVDKPLGRPFLQGENGLYICGDWCLGHSIESAWQSAAAVVDSLETRASSIQI
jgi:predicted NAD/FAD-dependent oxidoreductase